MAHERAVRAHEAEAVPDLAEDRLLGGERRQLARVGRPRREGGRQPGVLDERPQRGQREAVVDRIPQVVPGQEAEGLRIAVEHAEVVPHGVIPQAGARLFGPGLDRLLAGVPVGGIPDVVREPGGLHAPVDGLDPFGGHVAPRPHDPLDLLGERVAEGRHLQRMRQAVVDVIDVRERMDLRLPCEAPEGGRKYDAPVVNLERRARVAPRTVVLERDRLPLYLDPQRGQQPFPSLRHLLHVR